MTEVDWERRRRNIRILMAAQGTNPTRVANSVKLSPNTLSKFTSGSTAELSQRSIVKVVEALGLSSVSDLDTDNPLSNPKAVLRQLINDLPDEVLPALVRELEVRFAEHLESHQD
ncbi:helix-turn-helix transcriptional regulator [Leisingera sp. M658]|uniref:helix-turn-helix transcriptional regulator n=1 Tax=Leisingera sp. M658 TaxID=2867015 RepID=UPI0021A77574|nr:helix-turn-helix transcriptional regulator [Leisingera sp. M658]UWQ76795.1 helix-turn-helix transcriptional regulator [Leisingera sp. M658]